ncbi:uncharacterized protein LOC129225694 [Uloborus diversus]|uniref:uncharacterized protein LOC129225694 n=1 Tax=Uloborus diversus TaxID=327109 RepID=UPI00240985FA|nr:uncharacterized protein LOC129225694 [Uloborus diversus]
MGTSFLQEVTDADNSQPREAKSEAATYLSNHPLLTGATAVRGCRDQRPQHAGQYPEEDDRIADDYPFQRPRRRPQNPQPVTDGLHEDREECQVRFGLHYTSCFSKYKDFDDKFGELRHHVQSLPRGSSGNSPCTTLQLLAKVKSSPIFDRCHGNQYLLRTPYHMYNVKGELRYIVQDPPNLEQCYLEATCSIPDDVCRNYGYPTPTGRRGMTSRCESRHCHHTLLAWDPAAPDAGTFFDIFEYSCCCNCHHTAAPRDTSRTYG